MSSTMNSTSSWASASDVKGIFSRQYTGDVTSAVWRVAGSRRLMAVPILWHSTMGDMFPIFLASGMGRATRSSLHIGTISTEKANFIDFVLLDRSSEINSGEFFTWTGTTDFKKSTNLVAWLRAEKKKSMPSLASLMLIVSLCAPCFRISCSRKRNVRLCRTCCRTCTQARHGVAVYDFLQSGPFKTFFWLALLLQTRRITTPSGNHLH